MKKKEKKRKVYNDDDGRIISNMNVDGMPWYAPQIPEVKQAENKAQEEKIKLTKRDEIALLWGVMKAALLVGAVFAVAFTIFILFCVFVWFK